MVQCISTSGSRLGPTWPSDVRNAINYRPGLAYGFDSGVLQVNISGFASKRYSPSTLIDLYESELVRVEQEPTIERNLPAYARLLFLNSTLVVALCHELRNELIDRLGIYGGRTVDLSGKRRAHFLQREGVTEGGLWPIQ